MAEFSQRLTPADLVELSLEDEWPRLKAQLELRDPWLVFAFCSSREQSRELLSRSQWQVRAVGAELDVVAALQPDEIERLSETLVATPPADGSVTWVDGVPGDQTRYRGGPAAWEQAFLRMNDRRDAIQRRHPHGLVLCLPTELKPLVRDAAPDLWAKRVLTVQVDPPVPLAPRIDPPTPTDTEDPHLDLDIADPLDQRTVDDPGIRGTLGVGRELGRARTLQAAGDASAAIEVLEGVLSSDLAIAERAQALVELASARESAGDIDGAISALEQALSAGGLTRRQLDRSLLQLDQLAVADQRPELAAAAAQALVVLRREGGRGEFASALNSLAKRLTDVGRLSRAVHVSEEAVLISRELAEIDSAIYLPVLAGSLHNLSNCLEGVGRREEGLAAMQEAVFIRRRLAVANPSVYLPDLAMSLSNLSTCLGSVGRPAEGLTPAQESVTVYRQLAETDPAIYFPGLAASLNNLSVRLGDAGRREEGLAAIQEAVAIYRRLAEADPPSYLPDLANSLNNLAIALAGSGRWEEGLAAVQEGLKIRRQLVAVNPIAHLPDLAMALNNLSIFLGQTGRQEEGLTAMREAVVIRHQLAETNPAAYLSDWAWSLRTLANGLDNNGQPDEAAAVRRKADQIDGSISDSET